MSEVSLRLVHSRPSVGRTLGSGDDLAVILLISTAGLLANLFLIATDLVSFIVM